jgi:hypothetical protein
LFRGAELNIAGIDFSQAVSRCRMSDANRRMKVDGFTRDVPELKDGLLPRTRFIQSDITQGSDLIRANDTGVTVPRSNCQGFLWR